MIGLKTPEYEYLLKIPEVYFRLKCQNQTEYTNLTHLSNTIKSHKVQFIQDLYENTSLSNQNMHKVLLVGWFCSVFKEAFFQENPSLPQLVGTPLPAKSSALFCNGIMLSCLWTYHKPKYCIYLTSCKKTEQP